MATYYVDGAVGNDGNAGTSAGAGNAWATIQKALDTISANGTDVVYVKDTGTYSEALTAGVSGGVNTHRFYGYSSTPGDHGKATVSNTSGATLNLGAHNYYMWFNFIFSNSSTDGVTSTGSLHQFINCEFNNNGSEGINSGFNIRFTRCEFRNNAAEGAEVGNGCGFIGCIFSGNNKGISAAGKIPVLYKNVFYNNGSYGVHITTSNDITACIGNTLDGENAASSYGIYSNDIADIYCFDNIFHDWDYAWRVNSAVNYHDFTGGHNLFNSNNNKLWPLGGRAVNLYEVNDVPAFTDEAGDDYTLSEVSPAIGAGVTPGGVT
jgi:hypothetical protein